MKKRPRIVGEFIAHLSVGAAMFVALLLFGGALSVRERWVSPVVRDFQFSYLIHAVERAILMATLFSLSGGRFTRRISR